MQNFLWRMNKKLVTQVVPGEGDRVIGNRKAREDHLL